MYRQPNQRFLECGFLTGQQFHLVIANQLCKIFVRHPKQSHQAVKEPTVDKLKTVSFEQRLIRRKTQQRLSKNILIMSVDIGVRMVKNVVLYAPVKVVATNCTHNYTKDPVEFRIV